MTNEIPGPAYCIHTPRLVVRCWNPADAPLLKAAIDASVDHLLPYLLWAVDEPQPLQTKIDLLRKFRADFDSNRTYVYGIFNKDETSVVGGTGLSTEAGEKAREIGYWIHKDHVGQGYATEISAALTRVAFLVDHVERVDIRCDVDNLKSAAVPRKLGYTLDARLRRRGHALDGTLRDDLLFSIFASEFEASPAAQLSAHITAFDAMGRQIINNLPATLPFSSSLLTSSPPLPASSA